MRKLIAFIFALTFLTSNSYADITFWTTEVQPARMAKQQDMAKDFELSLIHFSEPTRL